MTSDPPPPPPHSPLPYQSPSTPSPIDRPKRVSHALLFVAILQTILGPLATLAVTQQAATAGHPLPPVASHTYAILWAGAAGLLALAGLARRKPLPAAVSALGLYVAIQTVDAVTGRIPLTQGIILKLLILAILIRTIRTAQPRSS